MRHWTSLPLGLVLFFPAAAMGQPAADIQQLSKEKPSVDVDGPRPARTNGAPVQISSDSDSNANETQLTSERASHQQTPQLTSEGRTAQPPQPLSRPAEGRTSAVERVGGTDKCDPAAPKAKQSESCKKIIETRAAEYARPQPTELSPEQRLLIDQQLEGAREPLAEATHRLATSGETDDSTEAMGIAAIVLRQSQPATTPEKKQDPSADAAVQAIILLMNQAPQP